MTSPELNKIAAFIRKHHVMTLATVSGGLPWCSHVFYAWIPDGNLFVFTTDGKTRHGAEMEACTSVAGGIALETRTAGRIQGLQIEGQVRRAEGTELDAARRAYIKKFPYAAVAELSLWLLEPSLMKLTDNTLGFGKKLLWKSKKESIIPMVSFAGDSDIPKTTNPNLNK